jgi:hypothetical protein
MSANFMDRKVSVWRIAKWSPGDMTSERFAKTWVLNQDLAGITLRGGNEGNWLTQSSTQISISRPRSISDGVQWTLFDSILEASGIMTANRIASFKFWNSWNDCHRDTLWRHSPPDGLRSIPNP